MTIHTEHNLADAFDDMLNPALSLAQTTNDPAKKLCAEKVANDFVATIGIANDVVKQHQPLCDANKAVLVDAMHYGDHGETNDYPEDLVQIIDELKNNFIAKYGRLAPYEAILGPENAVISKEVRVARNMGAGYLSSVIDSAEHSRLDRSIRTQVTHAMSFGVTSHYKGFCEPIRAELNAINSRFRAVYGKLSYSEQEFRAQPQLT